MYAIVHAHSTFSINDSPQSPEELILRTKELGYQSVTLTDHGTLFGVEDFLEAGEKHGINAVPGLETYLENREHFLLIARNNEGYRDIRRANKEANTNIEYMGEKAFPRMKEDILERHFKGNENIIATSACISGPISSILLTNYRKKKMIIKFSSLKEALKEYEEAERKYKSLSSKIKEIKKELTQWKKYTNKPNLRKLEKIITKIDEDPSNEILLAKRTSMEEEIRVANEQIDMIELQIKELKKNADHWKAVRDSNASKAKKYKAIPKEIFEMIPEEELYRQAKEKALFYKSIFPFFYLELQYNGLETEEIAMPQIAKIAHETGIPLIAGTDAHIIRKEDCEARAVIRYNMFKKHQNVTEIDKGLYVKSEEEMAEKLGQIISESDVREAISNTDIINHCHVTIEKEHHYPSCKSNKSFDELIEEGKKRHISEWDEQHEQRLITEIKVIKQMGYEDYHVIVQDYCNMMKKLGPVPKRELKNMPLNFDKIDQWLEKKNFQTGIGKSPGRGSAAGSLVCYLLGITDIDPLKYDLLFDRYLNPERVSMPDIDTDVKTSLRPYIIQYCRYKYGKNAVASILTKNRYAAKEAINAAGRDRADELFGSLKDKKEISEKKSEYLHKYPRRLTKLIDETCSSLYNLETSLDDEETLLLDRAKSIEGKLFATGVHAGGVVITDGNNIEEYLPVQWREEKKVWACEVDMVQVEKRGLLKMDILGLNTLDCISDCLQMIEKYHGIVVDISKIPFEDAVFSEIFKNGNTNSVFQFESSGMKSMLKRFHPSSFEDLIILVAMFRPGPMQYIDDVIEVKHKRKPLEFHTKELEPVLSKTYGTIVYQEQVMQIFQLLAGYSFGQADLVRRAMSKKKEDVLKKERDAFVYGDSSRSIPGCIKNGIEENIAHELFSEMINFAKYAFNKSHAASYAYVAYQTAWLKYHYPVEFQCAMFNNKPIESYGPILEDCYNYGIEILPPHINQSYPEFVLENGKIRYGLAGIKGMNAGAERICRIRTSTRTNAPFTDMEDFLVRTYEDESGLINKKDAECLINCGVFDCFGYNRKELLDRYYSLIQKKKIDRNVIHGIMSLPFINGKDENYNREKELELTGTVISENPLKHYKEPAYYGCKDFNDQDSGNYMGYLIAAEERKSKKGNNMLDLHILTRTGTFHALLLNQAYYNNKDNIKKYISKVIKVKGQKKGNILFTNRISFLSPEIEPFYLILDTIDKTKKAEAIIKGHEKGPYSIIVEFHFNRYNEQIPLTVEELWVNEDIINKLHVQRFLQTGRFPTGTK